MTIYGYEIRNEYGLGAAELYKRADHDNPEAILEGIATAGLVGFLKQLGDLAEFAADLFHGLHEEVTNAAVRSENLALRVQQLEEDFPLVENTLFNENQPNFTSVEGISWHPNLEIDTNLVTKEDMSSYVMEFYKESRGPPQLFRLDKFDVSGRGACLKRYTDPSFYRVDLVMNGFTQDNLRENKAPKAMIKPNSSSIEIARSLRMPHKAKSDTQLQDATRVKLKQKQFKGSLLNSMQNIFETDSPNHNLSKPRSNTNTSLNNNNPNKSSKKRKETNKKDSSSHKRLMSLGSLIEREEEPNELDSSSSVEKEAESPSSHISSSTQNDQATESEGNYISEEDPSENENYLDALTTMVDDPKLDSEESETLDSRISSESINKVMSENTNIPSNKMVKKAVSMKVSFEERESKVKGKLAKDSFSLSLRHMAKEILDFKDDLTEEEFELGENEGLGFVINNPDLQEICDFEKHEGLDENVDENQVGEHLVVQCENEMREIENLEMEKLEFKEELCGNVEMNGNQEFEILESFEMEKLGFGKELNENEEVINGDQESENIETVEKEKLNFGEELSENEEMNVEILETIQMEKLDIEIEMHGNEAINEIQESEILETNETEKFVSQEEIHENEDISEILESGILESSEREKLDLREELHENEEINEILESEILEINDTEKLVSLEEINDNEEINESLESEILENEMEKMGLREELHENEEMDEISVSEMLELNETENLNYKEEIHENDEINEIQESQNLESSNMEILNYKEEICENEETNEIQESQNLESSEIKEFNYIVEIHENKEINEMEELNYGEELHENEEINETKESQNLEPNENEMLNHKKEIHENKEMNEIVESQNLESNEVEMLNYKEETHENKEMFEISEPHIIESNEMEELNYREDIHENEEINEIMESQILESNEREEFDSSEEIRENEEINEILEPQIEESNEIEKFHLREEIHENREINEIIIESNDTEELDPREEINENDEINEITDPQILESNETEKCNSREEELHENSEINEILESQNLISNEVPNEIAQSQNLESNETEKWDFIEELHEHEETEIEFPLILDSIGNENFDFHDKMTHFTEDIQDNETPESHNQNPIEICEEELYQSNDSHIESTDLTINDMINQILTTKDASHQNSLKPLIDHYESLKEEEKEEPQKSSPKIQNTVNFEDIFSSYGFTIPLPSISNPIANNCREIMAEENNNTETVPPLPPLPPAQWTAGKPPPGALSVSGKLGRPPRPKPKPSRGFPKTAKKTSDKQLNVENQQIEGKIEIIHESEGLKNEESERVLEGFDCVQTLEKDLSTNGISDKNNNDNIDEMLNVENNKLNNGKGFPTGEEKLESELERIEPKKKPPPIPAPPKYPLFQVKNHDKTMLKNAPKLIQPSNRMITPSMLEEIRTRSFSLKPVLIRKPNLMAQYKRTNLKVAAMLEKAHAIRQAVASDDSDNDSWSE